VTTEFFWDRSVLSPAIQTANFLGLKTVNVLKMKMGSLCGVTLYLSAEVSSISKLYFYCFTTNSTISEKSKLKTCIKQKHITFLKSEEIYFSEV